MKASWSPRTILAAAALTAGLGAALWLYPADGSTLPERYAACPTSKCLTVVVAPWCGYCRASTPKLKELKTYLDSKQTAMRVVVGLAATEELLEYAKEFGPQTLIDDQGLIQTNGVPYFIVSDSTGKILRTAAGVPPGGIQSVSDFAARFGLP